MKTLICTATSLELGGVFPSITQPEIETVGSCFDRGGLSFLVTGIGVLNTYASLVRFHLNTPVGRVVQIGIAGAYATARAKVKVLGAPVIIEKEVMADLGAEDSGSFLTLKDLELGEIEHYMSKDITLFNDLFGDSLKSLPIVTGATVNTATGKEATGIMRAEKYGAEVESMEGAGALKFGEDFGIPVLQIRSISNIATTRDRESWDIVGAIKSLRILCGVLL
ncbi:futalosine nucleosidase [Candidatus Scalindua japonica]|uniref:Futalosine hydrolase n=1 Tax=Candidatus Scalindua japonica TaxID=1284222 RepID=A0A286TXP9_9BACT|nr:futalosine hydrolase [Candidatus Scalindua japonica]GAX60591.1 futalosine nucleosidase [Candidatus Scalindua japonica]